MAIASPQCLERRLDPASLNYELPKEPQARTAVLAKLFLEEADCKRHMEDAKRISEINKYQYDILWDMFQVAWCWSMIQRLVLTLSNQPYIQDVYIGVTESPWWRWIGCADYSAQGGNDDFLAHNFLGVSGFPCLETKNLMNQCTKNLMKTQDTCAHRQFTFYSKIDTVNLTVL